MYTHNEIWEAAVLKPKIRVSFSNADRTTEVYAIWSHLTVKVLGDDVALRNCSPGPVSTHLGQDKMAAILRMTYSNSFIRIEIVIYWSQFYWILYISVQLTIIRH